VRGRILFVCTGNICRSPLAHGLMEHAIRHHGLQASLTVDSAGTHARTGLPPDPLAVAVAAEYGIDLSQQRSRLLREEDFAEFDWLIALDLGHLDHLRFMCPAQLTPTIQLLLAGMAGGADAEVPDPYGRERAEFEFAARLIDIGTRRLLDRLRSEEVTRRS
jgi:protein-tyrosine phosphatase